jgi:hypothetical protein
MLWFRSRGVILGEDTLKRVTGRAGLVTRDHPFFPFFYYVGLPIFF